MPHIIVEATPLLARSFDFRALFDDIHRRIGAKSYALLDDFKSQVHVTQTYLVGTDPGAEFVVARLVMTNPRPESERQQMGQLVHDVLTEAIEQLGLTVWWQCCTMNGQVPDGDYFKTDTHAR